MKSGPPWALKQAQRELKCWFCAPQAVNKLAEIMNRKELRGVGSRRGNDTDMRRKEKENRKLQLELRSEKEKLNSTMIKYQREVNDAQAVSVSLPPAPRGPTPRSLVPGDQHLCL